MLGTKLNDDDDDDDDDEIIICVSMISIDSVCP